jgi:hypothetical protein
MTTAYEIPLIAAPQTFSVSLSGVTYIFTVKWNALAQLWFLDIEDANHNDLAYGIPLLTGQDLLAQLEYLGFTGDLVVQSDYSGFALPTVSNLGTNSHLYYVTTP